MKFNMHRIKINVLQNIIKKKKHPNALKKKNNSILLSELVRISITKLTHRLY